MALIAVDPRCGIRRCGVFAAPAVDRRNVAATSEGGDEETSDNGDGLGHLD